MPSVELRTWAAVDTFTHEPHHGELENGDICLITPHMGSMSAESEYAMQAFDKDPVES